jgi:WD40 repeat protein
LEPFTRYFIEFQGGRFDVPDRAFHSMKQTWFLSSTMSSSDVKELIPEFFYLPEFLENRNNYDMGCKQDGERVNHVLLPPWSQSSARAFIKKHREALESKFVSRFLHHWIDLMFGYKQFGDEAIAANNVFHPLTYEKSIDIDSIEDKVIKEATIAQISSYGQTPKQLFKKPHPEKDVDAQTAMLQDAIYAHPERLTAYPMWSTSFPVCSLNVIDDTPIALGPNKLLIYPKAEQFVSWGHWDQALRICSLDTGKLLHVIESYHDDDILTAEITNSGTLLVTGGTANVVKVWKRSRRQKNKIEKFHLHSTLYGHSQPIQTICASQAWSIVISGSLDQTCIIWDLNRLSYVRTLPSTSGPIISIAISNISGDIVTVAESPNKKVYTLTLYSINGVEYAKATTTEKILCIKFTAGIEGLASNVIVGGLQNGMIKLWSAWDLSLVRQLEGGHKAPVSAISFSADFTQLISGDESGLVVCWSCKKPREQFVGPMGI